MMKRRRPRISLRIATGRMAGRSFHSWTCPWCGDHYGSFTKELVSGWAIRHLNSHLRASATTKVAGDLDG